MSWSVTFFKKASVSIFFTLTRSWASLRAATHVLVDQRELIFLGAREDTLQRIEVLRRDRVVFVVVALRAAQREPEEHASGHIDAIVIAFAERMEAQRRQQLLPVAAGHQVSGQLRLDEAVVGHVVIEGLDHPVPVAVGERERSVLECGGHALAVARQVQPVTAPALSVSRRVEQPLDDRRKGMRRIIRHESRDFLGCRRQSDQIECRPANQHAFLRGRYRPQPIGLHSGEDKAVDRGARPLPIVDVRQFRLAYRLERPELAKFRSDDVFVLRLLFGNCESGLGPHRPIVDPLPQVGDLFLAELLGRRHLEFRVRARNRLKQETRFGFAGHDSRTPATAFEKVLAGIETQTAHAGFRVTGVAILREQRPHTGLEEIFPGLVCRSARGEYDQQNEKTGTCAWGKLCSV